MGYAIICSSYFPQNTVKIHDSTPAMNIEDSRRLVSKQDAAEKAWIMNNLPEYGLSPYDKGPYLRDETALQFVRWRMTGEKDQTISYVPEVKSVGIMVPAKGRYHSANIGGTIIYDSFIKVNMRDVGKYLTWDHNFRHHWVDFIKSDEGQKLAVYMSELGFEIENIDRTGIGFVPEKAIYQIKVLSNGELVVRANKNSYKMIDGEARAFGMDTDEILEVSVAEEIVHLYRSFKPHLHGRIEEERATKETLLKFYENLAESTSDSKLMAKYARIIESLRFDIATIGRYKEIHSDDLESLVDLYCADVGELTSVLEAEATYKGINTVKGREKYVSARLEEIAKAAENKYSEKGEVAEEDIDPEMAEYEGAADVEATAEEAEVCEAECSDGGGDGGGSD